MAKLEAIINKLRRVTKIYFRGLAIARLVAKPVTFLRVNLRKYRG